jgi:hypothetical protein
VGQNGLQWGKMSVATPFYTNVSRRCRIARGNWWCFSAQKYKMMPSEIQKGASL